MCVYMGMRVSKKRYDELMALEKEIRNIRLNRPIQKGYDYRSWPIIKPIIGTNELQLKEVHWEYIPESVVDEKALAECRKNFMWLNAKSENLFRNDKGNPSMWAEGAMHGRCLVPLTHFYEFRHLPIIGKKGQPLKQTRKVPYLITMKEHFDLFYIAGISREWTNETRMQSAETFALVTTDATNHPLMSQVHNSKLRMPTILPQPLAEEWLQPDLTPTRITEIARYIFPAEEMDAWPVNNFLTTDSDDPTIPLTDETVPAIVWKKSA